MTQHLDMMLDQMRSCRKCADLPLGPKPLFQLHNDVRILIAGQAPGRVTHERGIPFDDASGDRLRDWLGVDRATFYGDPRIGILPMGMCFPGTKSGGDLPPRPICAATWHAALLPLLSELSLIVVIGRYAIDWHLPDLARASVTDAVRLGASAGKIVLPHPSPRNNRWLRQNPWFAHDILPDLRARVAAVLSRGLAPGGV